MRNFDRTQRIGVISLLCTVLSACNALLHSDDLTTEEFSLSESNISHFSLFDSATKQPISLAKLSAKLSEADVIFIGEYHTHSASHRFENLLVDKLLGSSQPYQLSLEQFSRDKQLMVDQYLAGQIGEQQFIRSSDAWDNYQSDYRPLMEMARAADIPVIAANTPLSVVRCIARKGPQVISTLTNDKRSWVAKDIQSSSEAYQDKFTQAMSGHGGKTTMLSHSFYAQLARDNTMAESIYRALKNRPQSKIIHINGAFHSNHGLGTVSALKRMNPALKISIISPQFTSEEMDWPKGDFVYQINPLPPRYVQKTNRDQAIMTMIKRKKNTSCKL